MANVHGVPNGSHGTAVLSYWYGASYHTPFVVDERTGKAADIARNAMEFTHAAQCGLLSSFTDVTVSQSRYGGTCGKRWYGCDGDVRNFAARGEFECGDEFDCVQVRTGAGCVL